MYANKNTYLQMFNELYMSFILFNKNYHHGCSYNEGQNDKTNKT